MSIGDISVSTTPAERLRPGALPEPPPEIARAVREGARASGADFSYLLAQAHVESSYRPELAAETSSAEGLYQFIDGTWLEMMHRHGARHGQARLAAAIERGPDGKLTVADPATRQEILDLRRDPALSARLAGELAAENRTRLEAELGIEPGPVESYLAHFLGGGGAVRFLKAHDADPDQSGAAVMGAAAARANRGVFFAPETGRARSLGEIRDLFAARLGATPAASADAADRARGASALDRQAEAPAPRPAPRAGPAPAPPGLAPPGPARLGPASLPLDPLTILTLAELPGPGERASG